MGAFAKMWWTKQIGLIFLIFFLKIAKSRKNLEIQAKTADKPNAGMDGDLTVEICDGNLSCCNAGRLSSSRNDFIKGFVDVFYGEAIGECDAVELGDGQIVIIVTHNGIDAWFGDWIRFQDCARWWKLSTVSS